MPLPFRMFSYGIERNQPHEIGYTINNNCLIKTCVQVTSLLSVLFVIEIHSIKS